jgi:cytochrome-b5 reductase
MQRVCSAKRRLNLKPSAKQRWLPSAPRSTLQPLFHDFRGFSSKHHRVPPKQSLDEPQQDSQPELDRNKTACFPKKPNAIRSEGFEKAWRQFDAIAQKRLGNPDKWSEGLQQMFVESLEYFVKRYGSLGTWEARQREFFLDEFVVLRGEEKADLGPSFFKRLVWNSSLVLLGFGGLLLFTKWLSEPVSVGKNKTVTFDAPRFTPFLIVGKEDISTTSFILTLRSHEFVKQQDIIPKDPYAAEWEKGIWSVEFKQPQLQIARSYTPLPPADGCASSDLRFFIRRERGGEVSNYLARLPVHAMVELRGPHTEFELPRHITDVVFLAGGTGIAPAMQVAYTLLERRKEGVETPRVHIVWANRKREDCVGGADSSDVRYRKNESRQPASVLIRQLQELQERHPEHFKIDFVVDEEGSFVDQKRLAALTKNDSVLKHGPVTTRIDSKMLFVSGPEGFVNTLAGPKKWHDGKEGQGDLGGIIGRMGLRDWKVWKL